MKQLITSAEVIALAFGTTHTLGEERIPSHTILAAQRRLLRPALGAELYSLLTLDTTDTPDTRYQELLDNYLKTPLALYVASQMLPTLAVQVGTVGVVRLRGEGFEVADERLLRKAARRLRKDAEALLGVAAEYLAANPELFPEYAPEGSVSLLGGMVL
jgi:hypothetical protein